MSEVSKNALRSIEIARKFIKLNPAELAVEAIEHDLCDRGGIKHEWSGIDEDIRNDIKKTWKEIIELAYEDCK